MGQYLGENIGLPKRTGVHPPAAQEMHTFQSIFSLCIWAELSVKGGNPWMLVASFLETGDIHSYLLYVKKSIRWLCSLDND